MKRALLFAVPALVLSLALFSCSSNPPEPQGQGRVTMYMTDSPASFEEMTVVISRVNVRSDDGKWITVDDSVRTLNIVNLRNGVVAVLADAYVSTGHYTQIRLTLESTCTVVIDGQRYVLVLSDKDIKLNYEFTINGGGRHDVLLDFDAARSVVYVDGGYRLEPEIRAASMWGSGSIAGTVQSGSASALVTVVSGSDTVTTYAASMGTFKVMGLSTGSYTVHVQSTQISYPEKVITGVQVVGGLTTNVGTIAL